jgi:hypothetical protein
MITLNLVEKSMSLNVALNGTTFTANPFVNVSKIILFIYFYFLSVNNIGNTTSFI